MSLGSWSVLRERLASVPPTCYPGPKQPWPLCEGGGLGRSQSQQSHQSPWTRRRLRCTPDPYQQLRINGHVRWLPVRLCGSYDYHQEMLFNFEQACLHPAQNRKELVQFGMYGTYQPISGAVVAERSTASEKAGMIRKSDCRSCPCEQK